LSLQRPGTFGCFRFCLRPLRSMAFVAMLGIE
jgi:hypothetical protein